MKPLQSYASAHAPRKPKPQGRERFASKRCEPLRVFVRGLPCLLTGQGACQGLVEAAHVSAKATGKGDFDQLVPLCFAHHHDLHYVGRRSFEYRHQVKLGPAARKVTALYLQAQKGR